MPHHHLLSPTGVEAFGWGAECIFSSIQPACVFVCDCRLGHLQTQRGWEEVHCMCRSSILWLVLVSALPEFKLCVQQSPNIKPLTCVQRNSKISLEKSAWTWGAVKHDLALRYCTSVSPRHSKIVRWLKRAKRVAISKLPPMPFTPQVSSARHTPTARFCA